MLFRVNLGLVHWKQMRRISEFLIPLSDSYILTETFLMALCTHYLLYTLRYHTQESYQISSRRWVRNEFSFGPHWLLEAIDVIDHHWFRHKPTHKISQMSKYKSQTIKWSATIHKEHNPFTNHFWRNQFLFNILQIAIHIRRVRGTFSGEKY